VSFSYSASSIGTSLRDYLRFLLNDTVESGAEFQDEEIDGVITRYGSGTDVNYLASQLCYNQYVKATRQAFLYQLGVTGVNEVLSVDRKKIPEYWLKLAEHFRELIVSAPAEAIDTFDFVVDGYGRDRSEYVGDTRDFDEDWY